MTSSLLDSFTRWSSSRDAGNTDVCQFIKNMERIHEQPVRRSIGPKRVLNAVNPCGVGAGHTPGIWLGLHTWKLSEARTVGISMHLSAHRHDWPLTPLLALLPSQDSGGQGWTSHACNHDLGFPVTSPTQEPSGSPLSHLIRTKHSYHPGDYKGFRALCQKSGESNM